MRLTLFLAFLFGAVSARRNPVTAATVGTLPSVQGLDLGQPYYPFGWGLDDSYFGVPEEFQIHDTGDQVDKIKDVKRQVAPSEPSMMSPSNQEHYPLPGWFGVGSDLQTKARGWFQSSHHHNIQEIEEAWDGLE